MKKICMLLLLFAVISSCSQHITPPPEFYKYVNPFIGTDAHGHTYPGALLPWGMVQLSPDTGDKDWDWCSGYHNSDHSIMGFSHTHLSGTGCGEMGDILFMPVTGDIKFVPGSKENPDEGYRSRFSKETETAVPGYYSVVLDDYHIKAELTATRRVGFHRYTFQKDKDGKIIIDLGHGIDDKTLESYLKIEGNNKVVGYRHSTGFIRDEHIYFCAEFSTPFDGFTGNVDGKDTDSKDMKGNVCKLALSFNNPAGNEILVKVGLSSVSDEGAAGNIQAELPGWDFDATVKSAQQVWNENLSKIEVDTDDENDRTIFYTAFYHNMISPNLISDADGRFRGWDGKIHQGNEEYYTNFSLWDTYRGVHPFLGLMFPEKNNQFIKSMLERYREIGELPINEYGINETFCMIGNHAIPVIADAFINNYGKFDAELAYDAVKHSSTTDTFNFKADWKKYMRYGYLPSDSIDAESVSRTLEFAYDDWCVAQMAKKLGKTDDYKYFINRSGFYRNLFDKGTLLMRGRKSDGSWDTPFDPLKVTHSGTSGGDYTEGNAWQYTWHVQHDIPGLIDLFGGKNIFVAKLDTFFRLDSKVYGDGWVEDVSGLIGQYAQGNEPCHHVAYLYDYAGMPWKTQEKVNQIKTSLYKNTRDGLCGNDDCGQISVWYLYGALGFYPVCPASGYYALGTPSFKNVKIHLPGNKTLQIVAANLSKQNIYIRSVKLNGNDYPYSFLKIEDIKNGGNIEYFMSGDPQKQWGINIPDFIN